MTAKSPHRREIFPALILFVSLAPAPLAAQFDAWEREPIRYSASPVDDPVARLQLRLDAGEARLEHQEPQGYLAAVLRELKAPVSSQVLVFSKTSFQRDLISPSAPRALYFGDESYVGYVRHGTVLELAAMDPRQGMVFYTLSQEPAERPRFRRQNAECLQCHASAMTRGVPGLMVRSVHPDRSGLPVLNEGTFLTDPSSPLAERWGGWYVTGTHGAARHMGNAVLSGDPPRLDVEAGANRTDLAGLFDARPYLSPHSDIAALMVLEHQTQMHNLLTVASYQSRLALREEEELNNMDGRPPAEPRSTTPRRFEHSVTPLLKALLGVGEAPLAAPIRGTSRFTEEYSARGPRDRRGRSLRELDLTRRLFRHRLSPFIDSEAIDRLPQRFREQLFRRLHEVLTGADASPDFASIPPEDRRAALEILIDTHPRLPAAWKEPPAPEGRREEL